LDGEQSQGAGAFPYGLAAIPGNTMQHSVSRPDGNARYRALDVAKAIGIYLVVFGHSGGYKLAFFDIYSFHMPLFFFISGVLFSRRRGLRDYVANKIHSLIKPTYIYVWLFSLVALIIGPHTRFIDTKDFWFKVTLDPLISSHGIQFSICFWFTTTLFFVCVLQRCLYCPVIALFPRRERLLDAAYCGSLVAATVLLSDASRETNFTMFGIVASRFMMSSAYFFAGFLFRKYDAMHLFLNGKFFLACLLVQAFLHIHHPASFSLGWFKYEGAVWPVLAGSLCGIYTVMFLAMLVSRRNHPMLGAISTNTFHILALHLYVFFCLNVAFAFANGRSMWCVTGIYDHAYINEWWPVYHTLGILVPVWVGQILQQRLFSSPAAGVKMILAAGFLAIPLYAVALEPTYKMGDVIAFDASATDNYVDNAWTYPENGGRWTAKETAAIVLPLAALKADADYQLSIYGNPMNGKAVFLSVNGVPQGAVGSGETCVLLKGKDMGSMLRLVFTTKDSGAQGERTGDAETLGYFLRVIQIIPR
jgi:fucose 4-O-acetylase-like acetyltransferase